MLLIKIYYSRHQEQALPRCPSITRFTFCVFYVCMCPCVKWLKADAMPVQQIWVHCKSSTSSLAGDWSTAGAVTKKNWAGFFICLFVLVGGVLFVVVFLYNLFYDKMPLNSLEAFFLRVSSILDLCLSLLSKTNFKSSEQWVSHTCMCFLLCLIQHNTFSPKPIDTFSHTKENQL